MGKEKKGKKNKGGSMVTIKTMGKLWLLLIPILTIIACNNSTTEPMEQKEHFGWALSITAPKEYPIQVHKGGWLATKDKFITGITNMGIEGNNWSGDGNGGLGGGSTIPSKLSLTWVSYAEKKFWTIHTDIDSVKMLTLFRQGFMFTDTYKGTTEHVTYKGITIGLAPGGVVVLWLVHPWRRTEVGRYQAKETFVDVNEFYDNPSNDTQQQFYDWWYNHSVPKETQEKIKQHGIPFGLWDAYRVHYNWRFKMQFYKEDKEDYRHCTYLNGEEEIIEGDSLLNNFMQKPLPWRIDFKFTEKWAETEFNDEELMAAFKELTKENKDEPIEIIAKVGFMYNDVSFRIKTAKKEIPLTKVSVKMWPRAKK